MSLAVRSVINWESLITEVCQVVSKLTGNVMSDKQRPMVEARMKRRCIDLKLDTPDEYKSYWQKNTETENKYLIGLLTTHFTSFFREFSHFEWIAKELPALVASAKKEGRSTIKFWSAASSKGQEVWSLCMWLHHHMPKVDPKMKWVVFGSDIDSNSVKEGENGVYHRRELETAPKHLWEGLWVRGSGEISDWYKIRSDLKAHAQFMTMNLLALTMPLTEKFDVIMCRNVLIYFDRPNQENIAKALLKYLTPQGVLITGMSESLSGYGFAIKGLAPSIYRQQNAPVLEMPQFQKAAAKTLKVLCIDDSPTVITILKKVLVAPEFEIIGTAKNGEEAMEKLKTLKPDVITLDLHMPVMDGPTFLQKSGIAKDIPVVVVSSVGRDDHATVSPLFNLGVCDFVEKPTLTNIDKIGEELIQKLKMGWTTKKEKNKNTTATPVPIRRVRPNGHIIFNLSSKDEKNLFHVLSQQKWSGDVLTFYFSDLVSEALKNQITTFVSSAKKVNFCSLVESSPSTGSATIWLVFKGASSQVLKSHRKQNDFIILEESAGELIDKNLIDDLSPATSFSYLVDKLLNGE